MKRAAVAIALATAPAAHAEPAIELARCTAFDETKLRHAIDRALPASAARTDSFAIIVDCPDLVTAHVHVEPAFADGPIARSLDLGEIAGDLRIQLLALAIAEVIEVAATARPAEVIADAPRAPPVRGEPRDPLPLADAEPREPEPPRRVAIREDRIDDSPRERPAAASPRAWTLEPHIAARDFAATGTLLTGGGVELGLPWLRIGIDAATAEVVDPLGRLRPWLVTASIAREVACAGRATQLCAIVRVAGGVAGVSVTAPATVSARSMVAHYAQAGAVAELAHRFAGWSVAADAEVGWADGLIARSAGRDAISLAGVTMTGALGVRW
jgi:hypothetical protein